MTRRVAIKLAAPANDMVQEEIMKQLAFLSADLGNPVFSTAGDSLDCDLPDENFEQLVTQIRALAKRVQTSLRRLERKVVFSNLAATAQFSPKQEKDLPGVHFLGLGQVALQGPALRLFRYFDETFEAFGRMWHAEPLLTPTLIPARVLAKCDYFRSFPQNVTFASHLEPDLQTIDSFRSRHAERETLDDSAPADMRIPDTCLSPATCYHVYHLFAGRVVPAGGSVHGVCGKCFRFESTNTSDLRRLWDFTMREVVFMGTREQVWKEREVALERMATLLDAHRFASEIRTASDPFFIAADAMAKTYFQLSSETKYEISALLPDGQRLAVGSLNYHTDFFGRAFGVEVAAGGPMHSVCVAFGLERWVYAFLRQHGTDPRHWPDVVRQGTGF
jgi:seryl-tRNA synthetase